MTVLPSVCTWGEYWATHVVTSTTSTALHRHMVRWLRWVESTSAALGWHTVGTSHTSCWIKPLWLHHGGVLASIGHCHIAIVLLLLLRLLLMRWWWVLMVHHLLIIAAHEFVALRRWPYRWVRCRLLLRHHYGWLFGLLRELLALHFRDDLLEEVDQFLLLAT